MPTVDTVKEAIASLEAEGQHASIERIRAMTGGSPRDLVRLVKHVRDAEASAEVDAAASQARAYLTECETLLRTARVELEDAQQAAHVAKQAYQQAEENRLRGAHSGAVVADLRKHYAEARARVDTLDELVIKLEGDVGSAQQVLQQAEAAAARETARREWNQLAEQQQALCQQLEGAIEHFNASLETIRDTAYAQMPLAKTLGQDVDWLRFSQRILRNRIILALDRTVPLVPPTASGEFKALIKSSTLTELSPFARTVERPCP